MKIVMQFIRGLFPKETSKRIAGGVLIFCGALAVVILIGWFKGLPDVAILLGIVASPVAAVLPLYFTKAKAENVIKIANSTNNENG